MSRIRNHLVAWARNTLAGRRYAGMPAEQVQTADQQEQLIRVLRQNVALLTRQIGPDIDQSAVLVEELMEAFEEYDRVKIRGEVEARFGLIEKILSIQKGATDNRNFLGFDDFLFSGLGFVGQGVNSPSLTTFRGTTKAPAFIGTGATVQEGFFNIHLTHSLKADVDITVHIHCGHNIASPTGNVKWYIDWTYAAGYGGVFPSPTTSSVIYTPTTRWEHQITDDDQITIQHTVHNLEPDGVILGRIYRDPADPADTFANDCFLFHIDCHFELGQVTTRERNAPFTEEGF